MKPLLVRGKKTLPLSGNRNCSNNLLSGSADNKMSNTTSPVQIADLARATLKRLTESRLPPTPENYGRIYAEIAYGAPQSAPALDTDSTFGRSALALPQRPGKCLGVPCCSIY
ncbi:MAG: hypothetical protein ACYCSR_09595 [Thiomonas sp.]|uniref:Uncharacterized protein n=1 Tax=mine drainage metagenome TaxID=410659 RepID=E6PJV3_9ZZZZ